LSTKIKSLSIDKSSNIVKGESLVLNIDDELIEVLPEEVEIKSIPKEGYSIVEEQDMFVGVNTEITNELKVEGLARDIVRRIQALRKLADFEIDDHIETFYLGNPEIEIVFTEESEYIMTETLSDVLTKSEAPDNAVIQSYEISGLKVKLGLIKK
jgi:isoleucyl-tRNA synthetase